MLSCVQLLCVYILALSSKIILMLFVFTAYKLASCVLYLV